jgi:hypothetical protein
MFYLNRDIKINITVPGMRGSGIKENGVEGEFKYDIFDILSELL